MAINCVNPFYLNSQGIYVRCGKCLLCRLHKRAEWTLRIQLEASCWKDNSFLTLTYDDEHCPEELQLRDFQLYMKRLRKLYKLPLRYFMSAEYGDILHRPHFHQILFGYNYKDRQYIEDAWNNGFISITPLTPDRANYTCGYVQKKFDYFNNFDYFKEYPNTTLQERLKIAQDMKDFQSLVERQPFATFSSRPAVGLTWYEKNKDWLVNTTFISFKGRKYPIPRYFKELMIKDYPLYKINLIDKMNSFTDEIKSRYKNRFKFDMFDIEFNDFYQSVCKQRQIDLKTKNELYKSKKRSLKDACKVL